MTVTAPPRGPETGRDRDLERRVADLEALIEEARRRARRRRQRNLVVVLAAILVGLWLYSHLGTGRAGSGAAVAPGTPHPGASRSEGRVARRALVQRERQRRTRPTRRETAAVPVRDLPAARRAAASPLRRPRVVARRLEAPRSALGVRRASARGHGRDRKGGLDGRPTATPPTVAGRPTAPGLPSSTSTPSPDLRPRPPRTRPRALRRLERRTRADSDRSARPGVLMVPGRDEARIRRVREALRALARARCPPARDRGCQRSSCAPSGPAPSGCGGARADAHERAMVPRRVAHRLRLQ